MMRRLIFLLMAVTAFAGNCYKKKPNQYGGKHLRIATREGNFEKVQELLKSFNKIPKSELIHYLKEKDAVGDNALMNAGNYGRFEIVQELLKCFDENQKNELIQYLNEKNKYGDTALMQVANNDNIKISTELLASFGKEQEREVLLHINFVQPTNVQVKDLISIIAFISMMKIPLKENKKSNWPKINKYVRRKIAIFIVGTGTEQHANTFFKLFPELQIEDRKY